MANMVLNLPWRFLSPHHSLLNLLPPLFRFCATLSSPSKFVSPEHKQPSIKDLSNHHSINFDGVSIFRLLKLCRNVEDLKHIKSLLIVHGLIENEFFLGDFVESCFNLGAPDIAISTFQRIKKASVFLQNLMVRGLSNHGLHENLFGVYMNCRVSGCPSDDFTFPFVIKACSALGSFEVGKEIHCVVLRTGFEKNVVIQTTLVDFYAKNGRMEIARILIDRIPRPDLVSWNALIAGYSLNGFDEEALNVLRQDFVLGRLKPNLSTLASIIPVCTRSGCFDIGKSLHGFAVKSGYLLIDFLVPAFISMYAGDVDIYTARNMFDSVTEKNIIIWNSMISAYTQRQKSFEAFQMFRKMLQAGMSPDLVTFVSIIPSCESYSSVWCGESLHACVIKYGSENQLSVLTALVSMYAKLGDVNSAKFLFDWMPNRNHLTWNAMISGYVRNGLWDASLAAFCDMQFAGYDPDAVSIVSVLSACSKLEAVLLGKSVHSFSVRKGIDSNIDVSNSLLALYSDCRQLSSSFMLFHNMATRNAVSWNTLISGCVHCGEVEKAIALLYQMRKESVELDLVTLISILPGYSENENLGQGMAIHGYAIKMGFASDVSLVNALISMYCNCGNLDAGTLLFDVMPERNVVSWNALITGYQHHYLQNEVLVLFGQMIKENQRPNNVTMLNLLPVCCTELQGKSIHAFALRMGIVQETPLLASLIFMYARFENINLCLLLFELGKKWNISLWNAIMSVHVQTKNAKKAVAFFCELLQMGLKPDKITVLSLISACVQLNSLNLTHAVMAYMIHKGFDRDVVVSNALIDLYARCGNILFAEKLFECMLEKDAVSWNVMINGYGLHGDGAAAIDLFMQMEPSGMRPDGTTYASVLSACSHAGLVEQGQMIFNYMVECGISPRMEHYACVVDLLGRAGHLNEAYSIVNRLPCKPSISVLESLLGACRFHGNVELGEKVAKMFFEVDPENSGSFFMLYNIYTAAERWTDANRVRSNMEGRRLRKTPGFSLLVGDGSHDEWLS